MAETRENTEWGTHWYEWTYVKAVGDHQTVNPTPFGRKPKTEATAKGKVSTL